MSETWEVYKNRKTGHWRASSPDGWSFLKFATWRAAFDHAYTEATRELSNR